MGSSTFCIRPGTDSEYRYASGTSLSAPLAAGAAAIVLSSNLQLSGMEVREAIIKTASMAELPNNEYGYGIINIMNAINYDNQLQSNESEILPIDFNLSVFPNPFNPSIKIQLSGKKIDFLEINIYNLNGVLIKNIYKKNFLESSFLLDWTPIKNGSGIYFIRVNVDNTIIHKKVSYIK
jgi:subtilisin family serine protease